MFLIIQHPFQEIFFHVLAAVFVYTCDILKIYSFLFVHMWFEERKKKAITSMCVLLECQWLKRGFRVEALI